MELCQYKNIFGEPKTGAHSYRLFNIAVIDLGLTILIAYLISKYYDISIVYVFIILMLLGLILHRLFCVNTTLTKLVFGDI